MNARAWRRMVAIAGLSLVVGVAPAWAGRRAGPAAQQPADLWAGARAWIGELLEIARLGSAGLLTAVWGEDGHGIDPNGVVASPSGCASEEGCPGESADGDSGHGIDPDG